MSMVGQRQSSRSFGTNSPGVLISFMSSGLLQAQMRNLLYGGAEEFLQDHFQELKALATTGSELLETAAKKRWRSDWPRHVRSLERRKDADGKGQEH